MRSGCGRWKGMGDESASRLWTQLRQRQEVLDVIQRVRQELRADGAGDRLQQLPALAGEAEPAAAAGGVDATGALHGLVFVLTGSLSESRASLRRRIQQAGGRVDSAVTKATTHLLRGERAAGAKPSKKSRRQLEQWQSLTRLSCDDC